LEGKDDVHFEKSFQIAIVNRAVARSIELEENIHSQQAKDTLSVIEDNEKLQEGK
jgi:hypothetical protein